MIKEVTFHVFTDGCGFVDVGLATPRETEEFKVQWKKAWESPMTLEDSFFIGGTKVSVVEHANPFATKADAVVTNAEVIIR